MIFHIDVPSVPVGYDLKRLIYVYSKRDCKKIPQDSDDLCLTIEGMPVEVLVEIFGVERMTKELGVDPGYYM